MKLRTNDTIDISCTWGDGPDVCVNIRRDPEKQKIWPKGFFPIDFTGDEAIVMGRKLIEAGEQAKKMDRFYRDYMENEEKNENPK